MKNTLKLAAPAVLLVLAAEAPPALAGYKGEYQLKTELKDSVRTVSGKLLAQGGQVRIEYKEHGLGIVVLDFDAQKGFILFSEQKRYQEVDLATMGAPLPRCPGKTPAACYKAAGFVLAATEQVNGLKCERWENLAAKDDKGKAEQLSVWTAPGMPDLLYVRMRVKTADGTVKLHDLLDLTQIDVAADLFQRPPDFKKN